MLRLWLPLLMKLQPLSVNSPPPAVLASLYQSCNAGFCWILGLGSCWFLVCGSWFFLVQPALVGQVNVQSR